MKIEKHPCLAFEFFTGRIWSSFSALPWGASRGRTRGCGHQWNGPHDCKWIARDSENGTGLHPGHDWCFPNRQTFSGRQEEISGTYSRTPCLGPYLWTPPIASDLCHRPWTSTTTHTGEPTGFCWSVVPVLTLNVLHRPGVGLCWLAGMDAMLPWSMMRVHGVCVNLNDSKLADKCI